MENNYTGPERRQFPRVEHVTPLAYKVCSKETVTKLLQGYTSDISQSGLSCMLKNRVNEDDIMWLSFDRAVLSICEGIDKKVFIYQNGIIAKVSRVEASEDDSYEVGVQFILREEKNVSYIYPSVYFLGQKSNE
ncbi:MAG: PilZ domain-containing protein [Candidatus Omnitrophota bacterium]|jgi:c-di-GMP-binding flagellar brake protein YcgR